MRGDSFDKFLVKQRQRVRDLLGLRVKPLRVGERDRRKVADQRPIDHRREHLAEEYARWELDRGLHQFKQGGCEMEVRR